MHTPYNAAPSASFQLQVLAKFLRQNRPSPLTPNNSAHKVSRVECYSPASISLFPLFSRSYKEGSCGDVGGIVRVLQPGGSSVTGASRSLLRLPPRQPSRRSVR